MMKHILILLFLFTVVQSYSQTIHGRLLNRSDGQPVEGAVVKAGNAIAQSTASGYFTLFRVRAGDTLRVSGLSYKPFQLKILSAGTDTLRIYLEPLSLMLKDVQIRGLRNYRQDSLKNRQEYASAFNYKAPGFKDMFVKISPYAEKTPNTIPTGNTFSLASIDLLSVARMLLKSKDQQSKFKETLLQDEENKYVSQRFSEKEVTRLTGLKEDSLKTFMSRYRPSASGLNAMTDYDILRYIKKCYAEFTRK